MAGFPANGCSPVEHALTLVRKRTPAPWLHTAHLGVELPLERAMEIDDLPQMRQGQVSTQCIGNLFIG